MPLAEQRSYTSAGQLAASALLQLTWNSAGRIAQITQQHMLPTQSGTVAQQVPLTSAYSYDASGRLTASAHSAPAGLTLPSGSALSDTIGANASGYAWDANGNRSQSYYSSSTAAGTATLQRDYSASSGSNRLSGYTQTFTPAGSSSASAQQPASPTTMTPAARSRERATATCTTAWMGASPRPGPTPTQRTRWP